MSWKSTVQVGTVGDVPIYADIGAGIGEAVSVVLLADYMPDSPPGYPIRPSFTGSASPKHPAVLVAGTRVSLHKAEADALIAGGYASLIDRSSSVFVRDAAGRRVPMELGYLIDFLACEVRAALGDGE